MSTPETPSKPTPSRLAWMALAALGIVYGDIGTSPLYSVKECFGGLHSVAPTPANVIGVMSILFWALTIVVVFKYLTFVMTAHHQGEGGTFALLALVLRNNARLQGKGAMTVLVMLGLFGASLLYGESIITPAISVLSAVEGLEVATPVLHRFVVPITVGILIALFMVQKRGTGGIGRVFGPAMVVWFLSIAAAGLPWI
ncbi:MAG TPA: KUP/HAK/KT family potassium transporter, partial [Polyangiaceae bacterium]|nr:KUP/HAK/KT family potassium transporter [Polyangiaceae bacterium]